MRIPRYYGHRADALGGEIRSKGGDCSALRYVLLILLTTLFSDFELSLVGGKII